MSEKEIKYKAENRHCLAILTGMGTYVSSGYAMWYHHLHENCRDVVLSRKDVLMYYVNKVISDVTNYPHNVDEDINMIKWAANEMVKYSSLSSKMVFQRDLCIVAAVSLGIVTLILLRPELKRGLTKIHRRLSGFYNEKIKSKKIKSKIFRRKSY
jgi:hypothetical protein